MDLDKLFDEFNSKKVLVIGDAMIDAYMFGEINRISPEAPVPVVEIKYHENRLGGAANVALNLKSLGANPILCSVIGKDSNGILLKKLMDNAKLSTTGIIISESKKTTIKTRVIADKKHQLRVDEEDTNQINNESKFIKLIKKLICEVDVVIMQDYNKGVLTHQVIRETIKIANNKSIPTIVDPKKDNFLSYGNCTMFKPNLSEICSGMNIKLIANNLNDVKKATSKLRKNLNTKAVLLTLSSNGICIDTKNNFFHTPAFNRNLIDVSGAGDTVLAVAALCLAANLESSYLTRLSNLSGGIVCESVGVVPIEKEKLLEDAKKLIYND